MKTRLMIIALFLSVSQISIADTCPIVENLNPEAPPGGWQLFISPMYQGPNPQEEVFYFKSATHSINPTYYSQQVFCQYETCPLQGCPNFTLISTITYMQPATNIAPWDVYPTIPNTVVCTPTNHDPYQCMFTNLATQ